MSSPTEYDDFCPEIKKHRFKFTTADTVLSWVKRVFQIKVKQLKSHMIFKSYHKNELY